MQKAKASAVVHTNRSTPTTKQETKPTNAKTSGSNSTERVTPSDSSAAQELKKPDTSEWAGGAATVAGCLFFACAERNLVSILAYSHTPVVIFVSIYVRTTYHDTCCPKKRMRKHDKMEDTKGTKEKNTHAYLEAPTFPLRWNPSFSRPKHIPASWGWSPGIRRPHARPRCSRPPRSPFA